MTLFFTIVLVLASLGLIISVLMQSGKSAGLSGAIGGGAEQLFGKQKGRGYDKIFDRATKISAILFILSALILVAIQ
ncbi:MAG: preprotein translocase subunit SecG [delta proteobacterium ML8_F1]|nr:MAG: preprotein translocase subunit SecG [delta proteobacterium ML8_F1]